MRSPRGGATHREAFDAVVFTKRVDATPAQILADASHGEFRRGSKRDGWGLAIWRRGPALLAKVSIDALGASPIVGLDYHGIPGAIQMGYHWDLYPPLVVAKHRCPIDPHIQPRTLEDALRFICLVWSIVSDVDVQGNLFDG